MDTTSETYLNNWQQQMDLMCEPLQAKMLGTLYFVFFGIGGLLTFPVMDKIGRRKTHFIFSTAHLFA